jgi:transcriptional regulator with XRE-family HTH domain
MEESRRRELEAAGWRIGDAADFLGLTPQEAAFIEIRLGLARRLRELRQDRGWTQSALADHLGSSQSRVAKMEAADLSVSLDLMVRSLLAVGATCGDVGHVMGSAQEILDRARVNSGLSEDEAMAFALEETAKVRAGSS